MNIAIIEDEKEHSLLLKDYVLSWNKSSGIKVNIEIYETGEKYLFHNEESYDIDVIFMDIEMPGISGIELARKIRETNERVAIIFTTGIDDFIAEGYELNAIHYLIKPISAIKVRECLDKVVKKIKDKENYVIVKNDNDCEKIEISKIWWISAMGHGVIIGKEEGGDIHRLNVKNSFGDIETQLENEVYFVKTHRSYLVNLKYVRQVTKTDVVMDNEDQIPLSRRMYQNVNQSFISLFSRRKK